MRVAITSDTYYPMTNGVAVFAYNLAQELAKQGNEVMVICPSFTGKAHRVKKGRVRTVYLSSIRFPFYPDQINTVPEQKALLGMPLPRLAYRYGIWWAPFPYREMKKALKGFRPDVLHGQTAETIAAATLMYAKKYKVPLVVTGHAYPDNITAQFKMPKLMKKPVDAMLRAYFASFLKHGEYATMPTSIAIQDLIPKDFKVPLEAISNGVDLSQFCPGEVAEGIYEKYGLPRKDPIILNVGRVDPEKSIDRVIEAFYELKKHKEYKSAKLVIVGDGIARGKLQELVDALQLSEEVIFTGKIVLPDLAQVYRTAKMFVTASETETQGIVLLEAAASRLPLIAVDSAAVRQICQDGKNGILCRSGDTKAMAKAMKTLLGDARLRRKYGEAGMEIAKEHDIARTVERFVEIYREAGEIKRGEDS